MKYFTSSKFNSGQTLVEILIAVSVIILIAVGLARAATVQVRNTTFAQNRNQASKYAQEAMEWIRSERNASWSTFSDRVGTYCFNISPITTWNSDACGTGEKLESIFTRQAEIANTSTPSTANNKRQVEVTVSWTDPNGTHDVHLETILTNWQ